MNAIVAEYALKTLELNDRIRCAVMSAQRPATVHGCADHPSGASPQASRNEEPGGKSLNSAGPGSSLRSEPLAGGAAAAEPEVVLAYSDLFRIHGRELAPESVDAKQVMAALAQADRLACLIERERKQGIRGESDFQHRLITKWKMDLTVGEDTGIPFSEVLGLYFEHWRTEYERKNPSCTPERIRKKAGELKVIENSMLDYFGKDAGLREIDEDRAVGWRDFHQADNDLSNSGVNRFIEQVTALFRWASDTKRGYAEFNPFENTRLPEGLSDHGPREFSDCELQSYVNMLADTCHPDYPETTWIPLIMLFSGMRCNEVAQLYVDDIRKAGDVIYFRITGDPARNQRVKAESSCRNIPVHRKLIELGFLEYVLIMHQTSQDRLFPNCIYNERTGRHYDDNLGNRLNLLIDAISDDRKLRVYSLRTNFRSSIGNRLAHAGEEVLEDRGDSLLFGEYSRFLERALHDVMGHGHNGSRVDAVYENARLRIMQRVVDLAEYPVYLSRLKRVLAASM